jgi:copper homeostasis protein
VASALNRIGALLKQASELSTGRMQPISVLPGSGVNSTTVHDILDGLVPLGLQQIHMSGGRWRDGRMVYRKEGMGMGVGGPGEWGIWHTEADEVRRVKDIINSYLIN